jgi:hypothetical protein
MSHQKAALSLITELYTPQSINANESLRKIFHWYIRFDTFVGILSGSGTQLGREWLAVQHEFYVKKCNEEPNDLHWKYEEKWAWIRLTGHTLSDLGKRKAQNTISEEELHRSFSNFEKEVSGLMDDLHPSLTDRSKLVKDFPPRPHDFDSIVNPYEPGLLFGDDIFDTNMLAHDLYGYQLLFKNQMGTVRGTFDAAEMRRLAFKMCQLFEALKVYPGSPAGIQLGMQAGHALSLLFLRQDEKEIMWGRKSLAEIEAQG